ncbi:hypothetical protein DEJ46_06560 [Streptomyces venezuelae]|uniref:Uncharacterized protein n=1 Tax=Streptomyces venezuelae TaxID=54571 RepID=A0A5P2AMG8_STRVZ|nr:hypothetical protein DEJ46_06560 [Streptomyces venezuelae]
MSARLSSRADNGQTCQLLQYCDWRGTPLGAPAPGFAEVPAPDASAHYTGLMKRLYGLVARVGLLGSRLRGGSERSVGIRIRLDGWPDDWAIRRPSVGGGLGRGPKA